MDFIIQILLTALAILVIHSVRPFLLLIIRQRLSPLRFLPGPPSPSFFMGNLGQMHDQENTNLISSWENTYGSTFVYRGFIGGCRLMTTDPVAIAHILGNAYDYPKPDFVRDSLATMVAGHEGLLTVEGEAHKRQRKILTPAFTSSHIKTLTPIFWDKARKLRDIWLRTADTHVPVNSSASTPPKPPRIDVLSHLSRATLDIIGLAGFGYAFGSLDALENNDPGMESDSDTLIGAGPTTGNGKCENKKVKREDGEGNTTGSNELAHAFATIFSTARKFRVMTILQVWFPVLRRFRRNNAAMREAQGILRRVGLGLIEDRRKGVEVAVVGDGKAGSSGIDGDKTSGRDLLSVLVRSNMSAKTNLSQRMSIEEILCQISTFIAAGHETTASALTWCLYALSRRDEDGIRCQAKLRKALREIEIDEDEADLTVLTDAINKCEYLDWVVKESLRVHSPITNTMRVCMKDDEIPVMRSVDGGGGYVDTMGTRQWGIRVKKWDIISVPIQAINKSAALWGEDAHLFRPERWANPPGQAKAIPGLYSNILTFLNGNPLNGNRACIGYKFALIEIKIFLYVLLKDINFSIDPSMVIEKKVNVVTRPFVKSDPDLGNQLPLYICREPLSTRTDPASNVSPSSPTSIIPPPPSVPYASRF